MRHLFYILFFLISFAFVGVLPMTGSAYAAQAGISIVVNDDAISEMEVNDRIKLLLASSGIPDTQANRDKVRAQVNQMLIDEALKVQEAEKHDITVSDAEVQEGIAQIAGQNKLTLEQFAKLIDAQGIPRRTLRNQVKAQIAWGKFVQAHLKPQIDISVEDVDAELQKMNQPLDNPQVRDEIVGKIGMERLSRLQERHFQSVKSSAFIETRG
jgi:peptidyl-prolyl cis-trans isomerase SurA